MELNIRMCQHPPGLTQKQQKGQFLSKNMRNYWDDAYDPVPDNWLTEEGRIVDGSPIVLYTRPGSHTKAAKRPVSK